MATAAKPLLMTVDEYRQLPDRPGVVQELHWGQVVTLSHPKPRHVKLQSRVTRLLRPIAEHLGYVETELPFRALPEYDLRAAHLTYFWDPKRGTPQSQSNRPAAAIVYLSEQNARKTLETGVTTVRNLGASDYADIAMRDLINQGYMTGPRMFVSGYGLQITRTPARPGIAPYPGAADGVAEVMRVVRQQIAAGADWVKMFGSTGSGQDVSGFQTFTFDEMKAAVDAAHALGKRIAIHSYGPTGARDAVAPGRTRWSTPPAWTTTPFKKWSAARRFTYRRSITTATISITAKN
jgi:Amidohydrolase family